VGSSKARMNTHDPTVKNAPEIIHSTHVSDASNAAKEVLTGITKKCT
jgi:hypothetical protein